MTLHDLCMYSMNDFEKQVWDNLIARQTLTERHRYLSIIRARLKFMETAVPASGRAMDACRLRSNTGISVFWNIISAAGADWIIHMPIYR